MKRTLFTSIFGLALSAPYAGAPATYMAELFYNPPATDTGLEHYEFKGTPNTTLPANTYFITIEGEGANAGQIDKVINLSNLSFGSNGLLLVRQGTAALPTGTVLNPAPDAGTNVVVINYGNDVENGSETFVFVTTSAPLAVTSPETDLDTDNNGVLDSGVPAGWSVRDAVGYLDGTPTTGEFDYASQLGGYDFPIVAFSPAYMYRYRNANGTPAAWLSSFLSGTNPGPYTISGSRATSVEGLYTADLTSPSLGIVNEIQPAQVLFTGHVNLEDWTGTLANRRINFLFKDALGTEVLSSTVNLDANGNFSVGAPLLGSYDVTARHTATAWHWLSKHIGTVNIDQSTGAHVEVSMINGDVDGDNEVAIGDFGVLSAAFGTFVGDPGYAADADLDGDGEVAIGDFGILSQNFGLLGD